jgi:hypothetical protein
MLIGIISDIHDNLRHLELVSKELNKLEIDLLVICGDFAMPFTLRGLLNFKCPIKAVLGNGDPDIQKFQYQLENLEVLKPLKLELNHRFHDFTIDGSRIGVIHNDEECLTKALIESRLFDFLCVGHTHKPEISVSEKTTIINPGSLVGWIYESDGEVPIGYATLDTTTKKAELHQIP